MEELKIKTPIQDFVIIEAEAVIDKTPAGIMIPERVREKKLIGIVKAIGPGRYGENGVLIPMSVEVGDKVAFNKYCDTEVEIEDKKYLVMREGDIYLVY